MAKAPEAREVISFPELSYGRCSSCGLIYKREQVERLYNTLVAAKKKAGENVTGNIDSFTTFVQKKTEQIRKQYKCDNVEYSVELTDGGVKLKAKAKS